MTSAINPNNIDGTYPVAGQDNNSQGFRDNFTNIKTNFGFARNEITDLQNNAVLKSALTGTQLNNNMNGSILSNAKLQNMQEARVSLGSTQGAIILNYAAGSYYTVTTTDSITVAFTGFPTAGTISVARMRLQVNVTSISHTMTVTPGGSPVLSNLIGSSNIQGMDANTGIITFNRPGIYEFEFESSNGGSTISVFDLNRNRDPMYLPSVQELAASGNINLNVTNTVIITGADITSNLLVTSDSAATGNAVPGQIKTLIYGHTAPGNCLVNVVDAGWKSSGNGTANLSALGSSATFEYIRGKWYCIGNNGVVFT